MIFFRKDGDFSFLPQSDPGLELPDDGLLLPEEPGVVRARCRGRLFRTSSSAAMRALVGVLRRVMSVAILSFLFGLEELRAVDLRGLDKEGVGGLDDASGATLDVLPEDGAVLVSVSPARDMLLNRPRCRRSLTRIEDDRCGGDGASFDSRFSAATRLLVRSTDAGIVARVADPRTKGDGDGGRSVRLAV